MKRTLIPDDTIEQYQNRLSTNPESICPQQCPNCSKGGLWIHGYYHRNPGVNVVDQKGRGPIRILRFQVSSLYKNLLMSAFLPCSEAVVSMEAATGRIDAYFAWSLCELSQ